MKCCSCGEEIRDTARFCGFCGAEHTAAPAEAMAPAVESNIPELKPTADLIAPEAAVIEEEHLTEIPALEVESAAQPEPEVVAGPQSVEESVEAPAILPVEEIPAPTDEPAEEPEEVAAPAAEPEEAPAPAPAAEPAPAPVVVPVPAPQPAPVAAPAPQPVAQSVYQTPPHPQYQAPQPMYQPQYQAPQPVYQVPPQPQYQAPQPVYQPQYQAPQPVYQVPPQPQYQAPQPVYQPQYQAPQPQYQTPPQPRYQAAPQPQYQAPRPAYQTPNQVLYPTKPMQKRPAYQLTTGRGLILLWLLSIVTLGIYPLVMWSRMSVEINMVASRYDGKRTVHFMWMPFLGALTCGIYFFVWIHKLCNRVGDELRRRNIQYRFSAATYWLWTFVYGMVGAIITAAVGYFMFYVAAGEMIVAYIVTGVFAIASCVGPAIFDHKLLKAFNMMNADYNEKG